MKLLSAVCCALALAGCSNADGGASDASALPDGRNDAGADVAADVITDATACTLVKPYSSKDAVCNQCAQTKCCAEINGCLGDPKCDDDYVSCILACALLPGDAGDAGTKSCLDQCAKDFPVGKAEYDVAIGCADTKCTASCK